MDHGTGAGDSDPEVEDDQVDIEPPSTVATPLMKPGASPRL